MKLVKRQGDLESATSAGQGLIVAFKGIHTEGSLRLDSALVKRRFV